MSSKPTCIKNGISANLQFEAELYAHDPWKVLFLGFKPHSGVAGNQDVWYKITNLKYELKKEKPVYTTMATGFQEITNSGYSYGFQGQERDNEWKGAGNSINYKYRVHDPRIGRFLSLDPMASKNAGESPYGFAGNNPIYFTDHEGKYKVHKDIADKYPTAALLLANMKHLVNQAYDKVDPNLMKAFADRGIGKEQLNMVFNEKLLPILAEYSRLSTAKIQENMTEGSGPEISADELDYKYTDGPLNGMTETDESGGRKVNAIPEGRMVVNDRLLSAFEMVLNPDGNNKQLLEVHSSLRKEGNFSPETSFRVLLALVATVVHEHVHIGNYQEGPLSAEGQSAMQIFYNAVEMEIWKSLPENERAAFKEAFEAGAEAEKAIWKDMNTERVTVKELKDDSSN